MDADTRAPRVFHGSFAITRQQARPSADVIKCPYEYPLVWFERTKFSQFRVPYCYAGGSQGSVPISAGTLISTSSKASDVAISLWGVLPGM